MDGARAVGYILGGMLTLAVLALWLPWLWLPALVFAIIGVVVMFTRRRASGANEDRERRAA